MILKKKESGLLKSKSICTEFRSVYFEEGVSVEMWALKEKNIKMAHEVTDSFKE